MSVEEKYNTPNSSCCGRPMEYAKEPQCNYTDACMDEYCCPKLASIEAGEPNCKNKAVIPSVTVESVEGITNLANCFVHVNDINTTFYVDDKHRIMITWAGPVDIPGYDMENNPNGYRDQIVTDIEAGIAVIYDKHGKGYTFGIDNNLNIQDIIDNKLDEMAASGELVEIIATYLNTNAIIGFDTLSDLLSATNLVDGSYAHTMGYYTANDGGEALYMVVEDEPTAGDAVRYETLNSGLYVLLIPEGSVNVKQFGAVGNGTTDDTAVITAAMKYAVSNGITLEFNEGETYLVTNTMTINMPNDMLKINGNNANIKMNATKKIRAIKATCKTVDVENLKFNGDGSTQDQFDQTVWGNLVTFHGMDLSADNITIKNIEMRDWYGNGMRFFNYHNVSVENVLINNVGGHWYQNNTYDAFGDAIGFSGHSGDANIRLSNVSAVGKYKGTTLSRIGVTFDFTANKTDTYTNVTIENCNFINYDRGIHVENILGKLLINYDNGTAFTNVFLFNWGNEASQVKFSGNNLILNYNDGAYNGSHGVYNSTFEIKNSIIDCHYTKSVGMFRATGVYDKCVFNDVYGSLSDNPGKIVIKDSTVNLTTLTTYLNYRGDFEWINCVFNSENFQTEQTNSDSMKYGSCTFNNFVPNYVPLDLNNVFYFTDVTLDDGWVYRISNSTAYNNNVKLWEPNISKTFPVNDMRLYNYYGQTPIPSDGTIPLVPTFSNIYLRPNTKYLLITVGYNSWTVVRNGRNFVNYYWNVITTDSSGTPTISATTVVGNPSIGNYNLVLDPANNTIARGGTYGTVAGQWLLPYHYKDYLSTM